MSLKQPSTKSLHEVLDACGVVGGAASCQPSCCPTGSTEVLWRHAPWGCFQPMAMYGQCTHSGQFKQVRGSEQLCTWGHSFGLAKTSLELTIAKTPSLPTTSQGPDRHGGLEGLPAPLLLPPLSITSVSLTLPYTSVHLPLRTQTRGGWERLQGVKADKRLMSIKKERHWPSG